MIDIQDDHGRGGGHDTLATVRVLDCEPQRVPLCPSVFGDRLECVFKKPSKARCCCLTPGQQRAFSQNSRTQVAN